MEINYKHSKIYKIEYIYTNDDDPIYIGSTTNEYLSIRLIQHKYGYERYNKHYGSFISSYIMFDTYGTSNCRISLLENVDVTNSNELKAYEAKYIKLLDCVNITYNEIIDNSRRIKNFKILKINDKIKIMQLIQLFYNNDISNGYDNSYDITKYITRDELIINYKNIFSNNELYENEESVKKINNTRYLKFDDITTSTKQLLGYLNTILKYYSLKISHHQQTIKNKKNNLYKIEKLNNNILI